MLFVAFWYTFPFSLEPADLAGDEEELNMLAFHLRLWAFINGDWTTWEFILIFLGLFYAIFDLGGDVLTFIFGAYSTWLHLGPVAL